ncbi:pentapeptide repeat-containing protein, partial [Campylobacter volucris]
YVKFGKYVDFSKGKFFCYIKFFMCEFANHSNFTNSVFHNIFKSIGTKFKFTNFENSIFQQNVYFGKNLLEKDDKSEYEFGSTKFGVSSFKGVCFKKNAYFKNCIFEAETYFSNINAKGNIYFDGAEFKAKEVVKFYNLECQQKISFYNTDITQINFSQISFFRNIDITNAKIIDDFKSLKEQILKDFEGHKLTYDLNKVNLVPDIKIVKLYEFVNNFRDSFRILKNALIKDNNLLDASNFHKYELYCKEIELKEKKPKMFSKEWIDKWQLFFYRKLCDHHTNILQSLNSLIIIIGSFGILSFLTIISVNHYLGYKISINHLYFSLEFYDKHIKSLIQNHYLFIFFANFLIIFAYLFLVILALCVKFMRKIFIVLSYPLIVCIMIISPKILIQAIGIFTDKRALLDPLSAIGGIYTLLFAFVVYSFIKTIRKNSIVPS